MRKAFFLMIFILVLLGCQTLGSKESSSLKKTAQIWMNQSAVIHVEEAYSNQNMLYVKYRTFLKDSDQDKIFYFQVKGLKPNKIMARSLRFISTEGWESKPADLHPVYFLGEEDWDQFQEKLFRHIAPQEKGMGAVILNDLEEFFIYYDAAGQLKVVSLVKKPSAIAIKISYTQSEFLSIVSTVLREYLESIENQSPRVLFATSKQIGRTIPFFYVDVEQKIVANLKIISKKKFRGNVFKDGIKSVDHVLFNSHVMGMLLRPVSSMARLFAWTRDSTYDAIRPKLYRRIESEPLPPLSDAPMMDLEKWEEQLDKVTGTKVSRGTIKFLIDGDQFFPHFISEILLAKESIRFRTFIFDNDDYALKVANVLKEREIKDNVKVKVLLDGMGMLMGEGTIPDSLPPGYVPPGSMSKYLEKGSDIQVRVRPNTWFKADHIKTTVMDNKVCFTGGMNIGREYRYDWHDLMMEVRGPVVKEIARDFDKAWAHTSLLGDVGYLMRRLSMRGSSSEGGEGFPLRLLYTRLNNPQIFKAQLAAIENAQNYIFISNAYFSDNAILYALLKARRRGVDVRVILPVHGNHEIMNASNIVTANIMFRNGIRVFFYPGMSHIKAAIYDGWMCAGSANFDKLSLRDNLELNLATSHAATVQVLKQELFQKDFEKSAEMTEVLKTGLKEHFAEFLADHL